MRGRGAVGGVWALLLSAKRGIVCGAGEGLLEGIGLKIKIASLWIGGLALLGGGKGVLVVLGVVGGGRGGIV